MGFTRGLPLVEAVAMCAMRGSARKRFSSDFENGIFRTLCEFVFIEWVSVFS